MDLNELAARKKALEKDLAKSASALVSQFERETGVTPDSIDVNMITISVLGSERPQYIVGEVRCHISID